VSNGRLVLRLTGSLPEAYSGTVDFIQNQEPLPSFESCRSRLKMAERTIKARVARESGTRGGTTMVAATSNDSNDSSSAPKRNNNNNKGRNNNKNRGKGKGSAQQGGANSGQFSQQPNWGGGVVDHSPMPFPCLFLAAMTQIHDPTTICWAWCAWAQTASLQCYDSIHCSIHC